MNSHCRLNLKRSLQNITGSGSINNGLKRNNTAFYYCFLLLLLASAASTAANASQAEVNCTTFTSCFSTQAGKHPKKQILNIPPKKTKFSVTKSCYILKIRIHYLPYEVEHLVDGEGQTIK